MAWPTNYVIFRPEGAGLAAVFVTDDFKKAKYWLEYIALPGDVLCRTALHAKHSKASGAPEYWTHKEEARSLHTDLARWAEKFRDEGAAAFPEEGVLPDDGEAARA